MNPEILSMRNILIDTIKLAFEFNPLYRTQMISGILDKIKAHNAQFPQSAIPNPKY